MIARTDNLTFTSKRESGHIMGALNTNVMSKHQKAAKSAVSVKYVLYTNLHKHVFSEKLPHLSSVASLVLKDNAFYSNTEEEEKLKMKQGRAKSRKEE